MMQKLQLTLLVLLMLVPIACDSNNEDDGIAELAGEYTFSEFRFTPDSNLLEPVNMLDTLVVEATRLQLFSSGRFTLLYQFEGGQSTFVGGNATRTNDGVRISGDRDNEEIFAALLLPVEFELTAESTTTLTAREDRRVDLARFSDRYEGLPSVEGTLFLTLRR